MARVTELLQRGVLRVHEWLYKRTDGRVGHRFGPVRTLLLRTTGRRSGEARTSALVYALDGDDRYIVVASNGGSDRAPGWCHNLRADPNCEVQVGRRHIAAVAVEAEGEDYARLWKIANDNNRSRRGGRYDEYQALTERRIAVFVLTPVG